MKPRFTLKNKLCTDYPNCNCEGHLVYEENKKKSERSLNKEN